MSRVIQRSGMCFVLLAFLSQACPIFRYSLRSVKLAVMRMQVMTQGVQDEKGAESDSGSSSDGSASSDSDSSDVGPLKQISMDRLHKLWCLGS